MALGLREPSDTCAYSKIDAKCLVLLISGQISKTVLTIAIVGIFLSNSVYDESQHSPNLRFQQFSQDYELPETSLQAAAIPGLLELHHDSVYFFRLLLCADDYLLLVCILSRAGGLQTVRIDTSDSDDHHKPSYAVIYSSVAKG